MLDQVEGPNRNVICNLYGMTRRVDAMRKLFVLDVMAQSCRNRASCTTILHLSSGTMRQPARADTDALLLRCRIFEDASRLSRHERIYQHPVHHQDESHDCHDSRQVPSPHSHL